MRIKDIQDQLISLVGWRQGYNLDTQLSDTLLNAESGLYYQDAHPLLTLDNIRSIIPVDYPYTFSEYVETATRSAIATMVQRFITDKQLREETKTLLERRTFFDGSARLKATIDNRSRIVGMEIVPVRAMGVTLKIERIGLQMVGGTGNIRLYVFHSSQAEPYRTIDCNFTNTNGTFQWFKFDDLYLPYISDTTDSGGSWYLCYNQDELPEGVEALNVSKDWSREPCGTCNVGSVETWRQITKYIQISPFCTRHDDDFTANPRLFDVARLSYTNTRNYGINCEISVECDLSDFIIEQRQVFANVLQKQVAVNLLRTISANPSVRVNREQINVGRILYDLNGSETQKYPTGLVAELDKSYKALMIDTRGLDRICLCHKNGGVKYTTM